MFITIAATCQALALPASTSSDIITIRGQAITPRSPSPDTLSKRQGPATLVRFAKTWFKIGKDLFKNYKKVAQENDKEGAGFHRDFGDLVDTQLPDPPKPVDSLDELLPGGAV
ncbi:hypothetical protein B0J11DRAFT_611145 [Dendryphion nanum]|uniref:Uncharacterized protein n=1 Tax=Dendryphion nanum TaxID=256645 RepID=A0A9P9EDI4_9PLEO|nr:hypothetical protein B0J11DRAFT_611145 [Dendryphion nanum]